MDPLAQDRPYFWERWWDKAGRHAVSFKNRVKQWPHNLSHFAEYLYYYSPQPWVSRPELCPKAVGDLNTLRQDGVVLFHEKFESVAEGIIQRYGHLFEHRTAHAGLGLSCPADLFAVDVAYRLSEGLKKRGQFLDCRISFRDPLIAPLVFHPDMTGLFQHYYKRQAYYRNNPTLIGTRNEGSPHPIHTSIFHTDNHHQLSVMLLLDDIDESFPHMVYAKTTHQKLAYYQYQFAPSDVKDYELFPLVGPRGSAFIFDACGIHRLKLIGQQARRILHLNITTGNRIEPHRYDMLSHWPQFEQSPAYLRAMFSKIGCKREGY